MKYSIDTNVFRDRQFLEIALKTKLEFVISSVVQLEQYFFASLKHTIPTWKRIESELKIETIPITRSDAIQASSYALNFIKHPKGPAYFFRDSLIAASSNRIAATLITNNTKDFNYLPEHMLLTSNEFCQKFKQ